MPPVWISKKIRSIKSRINLHSRGGIVMNWDEQRLTGSLFFRHINYFLSDKSQPNIRFSLSLNFDAFFEFFLSGFSPSTQTLPDSCLGLGCGGNAHFKFAFTLFLAQIFKVWVYHFGRHSWLVSVKTEKAHGCASLPFLADFNFTGSVFEWPFETVHAAGGGRAASRRRRRDISHLVNIPPGV